MVLKQLKLGGAILLSALLLQACASPTVVQSKKASDLDLSCTQLKMAIAEAQEFEKKARDERGITGKNVAAALFFWPGLIGTYSNTKEAINAAKERQEHLMELYKKKNCHQ